MHKQIKSLKNLGGIWKGRKSEVGKVREAVDADPKSPWMGAIISWQGPKLARCGF